MKLSEFSCPVCRKVAEPANQIHVCAACHGELVTRGQVALTSTAEFKAMSPSQAAELLDHPSTHATAVTSDNACSWCGASADKAAKLLSNRDVHICSDCVALCADILTAELGDDWR